MGEKKEMLERLGSFLEEKLENTCEDFRFVHYRAYKGAIANLFNIKVLDELPPVEYLDQLIETTQLMVDNLKLFRKQERNKK